MTTTDLDTLISRVVDQEASDADWRALHTLAERDSSVWRELAQAQRDHADLTAEMDQALACVDRIDVPSHEHFSQSLTERVRVVVTWSGWAVAAALILAWLGIIDLGFSSGDTTQPNGHTAGVVPTFPRDNPEAALDYYMEEGRKQGFVLGEADHRVLDILVDDEGSGQAVIYLRQIIEIKKPDQLFMHPVDELGRPDPHVLIPLTIQERRRESTPE